MGFVKMVCPNCGANFEFSDDREFGFCNYCGTKVVQDTTIIEHRGRISVEGIANINAILDRVTLLLEYSNFDDALKYIEKALDINPRCYEAYIMSLMAKTKSRKKEQLGEGCKPLNTYEDYQKAIRFSPVEICGELEEYNRMTEDNFRKTDNEKRQHLESVRQELLKTENRLHMLKYWINGGGALETLVYVVSSVLILMGMPVSIILFKRSIVFVGILFFILAMIGVFVAVFGLSYIYKNKKRAKDTSKHYTLIKETESKVSKEYNCWNAQMKKMIK